MPKKTTLGDDLYLLPASKLSRVKNEFEKYNSKLEEIYNKKRVEGFNKSLKIEWEGIKNEYLEYIETELYSKSFMHINTITENDINIDDDYILLTDPILPIFYFFNFRLKMIISDLNKDEALDKFFILFNAIQKIIQWSDLHYGEAPKLMAQTPQYSIKNFIECINHETSINLDINLKNSPYKPILFGNYVWALTENDGMIRMTEVHLLILEKIDKERKKFERLKNKFFSNQDKGSSSKRVRIPEDVRIFVWRRDQGKCVECGSQENLEFDHIIPFSKGGSNTARNIQILCEKCNRSKSDKI